MELTRRDFLKVSGVGVVGAAVFSPIPIPIAAPAPIQIPLTKKVRETPTICCYCAVGCGAIVAAYEDGIIKIEGDPDHPINEGSLCPKGLAMAQVSQVDGRTNRYRLTKPLYRAPGATVWEEKPWDWVIDAIADRVKRTRDAPDGFTAVDSGKIVNRCDKIASLGGGELDNEECYLLSKMNRALGLVYIEHCARI